VPSSDDILSQEAGNSREDQLLRAVAAAPRPRAGKLLARALPELSTRLDDPDDPLPSEGDVVDRRYRIERVLGSGGMGIVFAAKHTSTERSAALKWLTTRDRSRSPAERDAAVRRFRRETRAVGRIRHPNVVQVYDAGSDPRTPYLVMEKLDGENLRTRLSRGRLSWDEAIAILVPAMRGVLAAHDHGIVHRDLKPENIFLARQPDGSVVPKVLDFGLSGLRVPDHGEPSVTRTGTLLGTPAYMALEQLRGGGSVDVRTDVYALGVILYETLSGLRPYEGTTAADFAALVATQRPPALEQLCPELRGWRAAAVMKALGRTPDERHASVQAFIAALTPRSSLRRPAVRGSLLIAAAALAVSGFVALGWPTAEPPRRASVTQREPGSRPPRPATIPVWTIPAVVPVEQPRPVAPAPRARPRRNLPAPAAVAAAPRLEAVPLSGLRPQDFSASDVAPQPTIARTPAPAQEATPPAPSPRLDLARDQF
jgi:hypothetical protein